MRTNLPDKWCVFEYRSLGTPGNPVRQAEPIYDDIHAAVAAIESHIEQYGRFGAGSATWSRWQLHSAIRSRSDSKVPSWASGFLYYRGSPQSGYDLMPTIFRGLFKKNSLAENMLAERASWQERFLTKILSNPEIAPALASYESLTETQKLAVARHYGCPSEFLDFTANPKVAAYFATNDAKVRNDDIGVIYVLNLLEFLNLPGSTATAPLEDGFRCSMVAFGRLHLQFLTPVTPKGIKSQTANVQFREPTEISLNCIVVPGARRIEAQQGVFFRIGPPFTTAKLAQCYRDIGAMWFLLKFLCHKICFFHSAGPYTAQDLGVTKAILMPPGDPIVQLVQNEFGP